MICNVCGREARGFGIRPSFAGRHGPNIFYCSMRCMKMIDKTKNEIEALAGASQYGGEYLQEQGIMVHCSKEQWMQFVECVVNGWVETLQDRTPKETDVPF